MKEFFFIWNQFFMCWQQVVRYFIEFILRNVVYLIQKLRNNVISFIIMYGKYSFEDYIVYVDEFNVKRIYYFDQEENVIFIIFNIQLYELDMIL